MLSDSILANAGWLFFAMYSAVVAAVSIAAFGGDVPPAKANVDAARESTSADRVQPARPR